MTRVIAGVLLALVTQAAQADVWGGLEPGKHTVGFETRYLVDETRADGPPESPDSLSLQVSVWYPAAEHHAPTMTIADYVALTALEFSAAARGVSEDERRATLDSVGAFPLEGTAAPALEQVLRLTGRAHVNAKPATGRFPLLVVIPGNHDPAWRHFLLGEYLASHGYVVAAFPSPGRRVRDAVDMNFGFGPFRQQLLDTEFVVDYLRGQHENVDPDRVLLFGFSMGGNTGGYSLLRNPDIRGFVCLDCGIGSSWGTEFLNDSADAPFSAAVERPLAFLHITKRDERNDMSFIDRFENGHAYHAIVDGARHFNFTSLGAIAAEVPGVENEDWLAPDEFARAVHDESLNWVRVFLDAHTRGDRQAAAELRASDPRATVHLGRVVTP